MNRRAASLLVVAAAASPSVARAQDATPPAPAETPRKHKADPRALELVRKADRTTYRPTAAGLKSLRCNAEYVMTNGTRYRMAYAMEAPGKSTFAFRASDKDDSDPWSEKEKFKDAFDDLFDGPRLEQSLEPYELSCRDVDGTTVVIADEAAGEKSRGGSHVELRFLPEGPVAEEGPGDDAVARHVSVRTRRTYEPSGDKFVRKRGVYDGYGDGSELYQYRDVDGVKLPVKYTTYCAGLGGSLTISDIEVNVAVTGPATLPAPAGPPTQAELDALDVPALVAKLREPFVGKEPDPVKVMRIVRAIAKKGDDAKKAIPILVAFLGCGRGEAPKKDAPADFVEFHEPLVDLLVKLRPDSIRPLIGALQSPVTDQREWAAVTLGWMGKDGAPATDALIEAIDDKMWMVGINAAAAARKVGCPAERALPHLVKQADVWWMGEAYADEAIEFAKADPDGDAKLVAALLAAPLKIEREKDGDIHGIEWILRKRGAALAPKFAAQLGSSDAAVVAGAETALVAIGAPARAGVESFIASRPATGDDAARDRARKLLERLPAK
jgi:hypothetical protein